MLFLLLSQQENHLLNRHLYQQNRLENRVVRRRGSQPVIHQANQAMPHLAYLREYHHLSRPKSPLENPVVNPQVVPVGNRVIFLRGNPQGNPLLSHQVNPLASLLCSQAASQQVYLADSQYRRHRVNRVVSLLASLPANHHLCLPLNLPVSLLFGRLVSPLVNLQRSRVASLQGNPAWCLLVLPVASRVMFL